MRDALLIIELLFLKDEVSVRILQIPEILNTLWWINGISFFWDFSFFHYICSPDASLKS
jgi:hypothetical protein